MAPTLHCFRSARRRAAVQRKEMEVSSLRYRLAEAEAEVRWWRTWWWGSGCVLPDVQERVDELQTGCDDEATEDKEFFEGSLDENAEHEAAGCDNVAVEDEEFFEGSLDANEEEECAEYEGEKEENAHGDEDEVTFAGEEDAAGEFRSIVREHFAARVPLQVLAELSSTATPDVLVRSTAERISKMADALPTHVVQVVRSHIEEDTRTALEAKLRGVVAERPSRLPELWQLLPVGEKLRWERIAVLAKASYDEERYQWKAGRRRDEPKIPDSPYFAWVRHVTSRFPRSRPSMSEQG